MSLRRLAQAGSVLVIGEVVAKGAAIGAAGFFRGAKVGAAKGELLAVGLTFEGKSNTRVNPADNRTTAIGDSSVRCKRDQFVPQFRQPANMVGDKRTPAKVFDGICGNTVNLVTDNRRSMLYHVYGTYLALGLTGTKP